MSPVGSQRMQFTLSWWPLSLVKMLQTCMPRDTGLDLVSSLHHMLDVCLLKVKVSAAQDTNSLWQCQTFVYHTCESQTMMLLEAAYANSPSTPQSMD